MRSTPSPRRSSRARCGSASPMRFSRRSSPRSRDGRAAAAARAARRARRFRLHASGQRAARAGAARLVRQPPPASARGFPGAAQGPADDRLHASRDAGLGPHRLPRAARRTRGPRRRSARDSARRRATRPSTATSASSARAPAAVWLRPCWRRPGSTWSCSRRAGTTRRPTSTVPSWTASAASTTARGTTATDDQGIGILAGACLGGGTVVNYTTSFRTPDDVREEWGGAFATDAFTAALDRVCERIGVNDRPEPALHAARRSCDAGLERLGWHVAPMPRNVRGCDQGRVLRLLRLRLPARGEAVDRAHLARRRPGGRRAHPRAHRAERVTVEAGRRAASRPARGRARRVLVRSRAVVAACGAIETPALLRALRARARLSSGATCTCIRSAAPSASSTRRSDPGRGRCRRSTPTTCEGVKLETTAIHPALLVGAAPWRGAVQHAELMSWLRRSTLVGVLAARPATRGEVRVGRDGRPGRSATASRAATRRACARAPRPPRASSRRRARSGSCPATRPTSSTSPDARATSGRSCATRTPVAGVRVASRSTRSTRWARPRWGRCATTWARSSVTKRLVVADASTFPSASGVNPMVTIEAIAHLNASALAARLT